MFTENAHDIMPMILTVYETKMIFRRPNLSDKNANKPPNI